MRKEITVKLLKDPENFIRKDEVLEYIIALEAEGRLRELPKNLYVYYVIALFADEVNNGGVEGYLENPSGKTLRDLRTCAEHLSHDVITPFLIELCDYVDAKNKNFGDFDGRFYDIEKKHDFRKAALKYYKENFEAEKMKIPVIKEKESDTCAYFKVTEEGKCDGIEEGLKAFLEVLAGFSELRFRVFIYTYINGDYAVYGRSLDGNIDLGALMANWSENAGLKTARMKMCDCFGEISIESLSGGRKYGITVTKSGFEKDEYKIKLKFIAAGYDTLNTNGFSRVTLKKFEWGEPELYEKIKSCLERNFENYPNIDGVAKEGFTM